MAKGDRLDIPPGLRTAVQQAVKTAVAEALDGINLLDLKECQAQLKATRLALIDMQQNFDVWRKLAELRGDQSEQRGAQIDQLHTEVTQLQMEIALLRSALDNNEKDNTARK